MNYRKVAWYAYMFLIPFVAGTYVSGILTEGYWGEENRSAVKWTAFLLFCGISYVASKIFTKFFGPYGEKSDSKHRDDNKKG